VLAGRDGEHAVDEPPGQPAHRPAPEGVGQRRERSTSNDSSARLSVVLTDCPPGPDEREKRHDSSASGTVNER
jgi:hypothetical protein